MCTVDTNIKQILLIFIKQLPSKINYNLKINYRHFPINKIVSIKCHVHNIVHNIFNCFEILFNYLYENYSIKIVLLYYDVRPTKKIQNEK